MNKGQFLSNLGTI